MPDLTRKGNIMKRLLLTITIVAMLNSTALAGQFEDGLAAYNRRDYKTALRILQPLADGGNADAQVYMSPQTGRC